MFQSYLIMYPAQPTAQERLAARELRRYVYLRTGQLLPLLGGDDLPEGASGYVVSHEGEGQHYRIATERRPCGGKAVRVHGGREGGMLYAAYRVAEHLGVRFALHGDIIPDRPIPPKLPEINDSGKPLFELRGVLPFHDFPEGPDWWSEDDYKSVIAQLPKLKMNFFGLHTYPEKEPDPLSYNAEPGVWIGLAEEAGTEDAPRVASGYPSRHFTTASEVWGFAPRMTGSYYNGAGELFDRDDYGAPYMKDMTPWPQNEAAEKELFDRFGNLLAGSFAWAGQLGVRTCVGTELPLKVPDKLRRRLASAGVDPDSPETVRRLYEGMFARILRTHPLDYYWLWTPEDWTWKGNTLEQSEAIVRDIEAALAAARAAGAGFQLATCGWVLGPEQDRTLYDRILPSSMPFSCINRQFGFEYVDAGFEAVGTRPKWAIPWLEDDPALVLPQLWAGRMRRDAADAAAYGCTGLMGIHWRTRMIDPSLSALAQAGWEPAERNASEPGYAERAAGAETADNGRSDPRAEGAIGGSKAEFAHASFAAGTSSGLDATELQAPESSDAASSELLSAVYATARGGADGYRLRIPGGHYQATLILRPWATDGESDTCAVKVYVYGQSEGQAVSRIVNVADRDENGKAIPCRLELPVQVVDGILGIMLRPVRGEAALCAIEVQGKPYGGESGAAAPYSRKINCGGDAAADYEADLPEMTVRERHMPTLDFYADWAAARFGTEAAADIAAQFAAVDGRLPRPVVWVTGPGSTVAPDRTPWEVASQDYAFLDRLEALRDRIVGAGNLERFDYWLHQFRYLRSTARIGCELGVYEAEMERVEAEQDVNARRSLARARLLPLRLRMIALIAELNRHLLATVSTPGELGTVANLQQQALFGIVEKAGRRLEELLGEPLPPDAWPSQTYTGAPRIIVPTVRTLLAQGEALRLTVLFLGVRPKEAALYWRPLGEGSYRRIPLRHEARGVYRCEIPGGTTDIEYYVIDPDSGLQFPATAGKLNQTVVRM